MDEVLFMGRVHSFVFSDQCMLYLIDVTLYSADATLYFSLWGVPMGFPKKLRANSPYNITCLC
jgi:hypothetical protein